MVSEELKQVVDSVLRQQLDAIGYDRAEIAEDEDHTGDPILRIRIHYHRVGDFVDPTPTFSVVRFLRNELRQIGDQRFPHLTHMFPEDQDLKVA